MSTTNLPIPTFAPNRANAGTDEFDGPSFEDRMGTVDFRVAPTAHITVDSDICRSCTTKACVTACPAALFVPTSDGGILFNYEQCFECGTCYLVCNAEGALTWTYPEGGAGVALPSLMIAALLKLVDLRVEIDPLSGEPAVQSTGRALGASPADLAALETALRLAGDPARGGDEVLAVCAGPSAAAEPTEALLRELLAAGVTRAIRVEIPAGATSAQVAAAIAPVVADARFVLCGDASLDRGSGSVPAFVAAKLQAAQALGLTTVTPTDSLPPTTGTATQTAAPQVTAVAAERRLDGGRREQLRVEAPAVLSVEAGLRLRRAPLAAVIRARTAAIEVVRSVGHAEPPERIRPYRAPAPPAPAAAAADPRDRVLALTGMLAPARARRVVEADPDTCALELLNYLSEHGYR